MCSGCCTTVLHPLGTLCWVFHSRRLTYVLFFFLEINIILSILVTLSFWYNKIFAKNITCQFLYIWHLNTIMYIYISHSLLSVIVFFQKPTFSRFLSAPLAPIYYIFIWISGCYSKLKHFWLCTGLKQCNYFPRVIRCHVIFWTQFGFKIK